MRGHPIPEVSSNQLYNWAMKLVTYLRVVEREIENPSPKAVQLEHAKAGAKAVRNGLLMWDNVGGYPIIAKDGAWHKIDITPTTLVGIKDNVTR